MHSIKTIFGNILLTTSRKGITRLYLNRNKTKSHNIKLKPNKNVRKSIRLLQRYFKGEKVDLKVKVDLSNLSVFTRQVLRQTQKIPYGKTTTYSEIAKIIGHAKASRAVGQALGSNPLPIIIPCHRVIRKDKSLGGYAYGLSWKKRLLEIES